MSFTDYFPVGGILLSGSSQLNPAVWLPCDGSSVSKVQYPELFEAIGYTYGGEQDNFLVPDLRGVFLRGVSGTSGVDPDATRRLRVHPLSNSRLSITEQVGAIQSYATALPPADKHFIGAVPNLPVSKTGVSGETDSNAAAANGDFSGNTCTAGGDNETRPKNLYLAYFIKSASL